MIENGRSTIWMMLREKGQESRTKMFHYFLYELTDEERDEVRPYLNLTHLLIWALAVPRSEPDGTLWSNDYVTDRVLG